MQEIVKKCKLTLQSFKVGMDKLRGLLWSALIAVGWLVSLLVALSLDMDKLSVGMALVVIGGRTFLHTGMFITAHDAAHGTLYSPSRVINDRVGALAISLYALLPYPKFVECHGLHHQIPGRVGDPDYHDGKHSHPLAWYAKFMQGYLDDRQSLRVFVWFTIIFHVVRVGFGVSALNILLFWVLPILLSSLQLFFFGTYLPHRQPQGGYSNRHHALSSHLPVWLSFVTCYHFGYHWEHHEYPHLPWFALPSAIPKS
jgi:beta-carotene ketolase (CrtW type)